MVCRFIQRVSLTKEKIIFLRNIKMCARVYVIVEFRLILYLFYEAIYLNIRFAQWGLRPQVRNVSKFHVSSVSKVPHKVVKNRHIPSTHTDK